MQETLSITIDRTHAEAALRLNVPITVTPQAIFDAINADYLASLTPSEEAVLAALDPKQPQTSVQIAATTGLSAEHIRRLLQPRRALRRRGLVKSSKAGYHLARGFATFSTRGLTPLDNAVTLSGVPVMP